MSWLLMVLAGAAGAASRFAVDRAVMRRFSSDAAMPWGTWVVNLSGSLLLGVVMGASLEGAAALAIGTGFLGAYTTFSTWMIESIRLMERGAWRLAAMNLLGPAISGPPAAVAGLLLGGAIF